MDQVSYQSYPDVGRILTVRVGSDVLMTQKSPFKEFDLCRRRIMTIRNNLPPSDTKMTLQNRAFRSHDLACLRSRSRKT